MGETRQTLTQEFLHDQIVVQKKSCVQVAADTGWERSTIAKWCRRHKIPLPPPHWKDRDDHIGWKGGRRTSDKGYVHVYRPDHPHCYSNGYILEHRLVMEDLLGRHLLPDEVVHHRNGIRHDNRPENLELFSNNPEHVASEHNGTRTQETGSLLQGIETRRKGKLPKAELAKMYETKSAAQIAREYGANEATIRRWLREYGIQTVATRERFPANEQLAADFATMTTKEVAAKYGGTVKQLYKALNHRKTGVQELRRQAGHQIAEWPDIDQLAEDLQTLSTRAVADKYGGTLNQLHQVLHNHGTGVRKLRQQGSDS